MHLFCNIAKWMTFSFNENSVFYLRVQNAQSSCYWCWVVKM